MNILKQVAFINIFAIYCSTNGPQVKPQLALDNFSRVGEWEKEKNEWKIWKNEK